MVDKKPPFRDSFFTAMLAVLGIVTSVLFIMGVGALWKGRYGWGSLFLALVVVLTLVFFRKNKAGLIVIGLIWLMINTGVNGIVHPTPLGIFITVGSAVGIALLVRWMAGRPRTSNN
jgi:hypothetical protein